MATDTRAETPLDVGLEQALDGDALFPRYRAADPLTWSVARRALASSSSVMGHLSVLHALLGRGGNVDARRRLPRLALPRLVPAAVAQTLEPDESTQKQTTFVEIELVDQTGTPVPGEAYRIQLPSGATLTGKLTEQGRAFFDGLDPGTCRVSFPDRHAEEWRPL